MTQPMSTGERAMSLREYLDLPGELRAEYVDGRALVNPPPTFAHQQICHRLVVLLEAAVAAPAEVVAAAGWQIGAQHIRVPDVMLVAQRPAGPLVTAPPLVCAEVLSGNRSDDLVRKATEYLEAGVTQYWIIDPRDRVVDAFVNAAGGWHTLARLTDENPVAEIGLPQGVGRVQLDLGTLMP